MYPPRIVVSPKAVAVASALGVELPYDMAFRLAGPQVGPIVVEVADEDLATRTGLKPDTVSRAVRELAGFGLIVSHHTAGGVRTVTLDPCHWVWDAIAATAGQEDAR